MLSSKVAWLALVSVIVVCGYPIGGPPDALDQKLNYGQYIRNHEKQHRFSYNDIDEPLQPVLEDEEVELSLLAQPVSQPPSEDGFSGSTLRPIAPSRDSSEEDDSDEIVKVEKDPSSEEAPVKYDTDDIKVTLESSNEKQEEPEQVKEAYPQAEETVPVADAAQESTGSEVETGSSDQSSELPQAQDENQPEQTPVIVSDASEGSASPVAAAPVESVAQEEPKEEQAAEPVQTEDSPSLDAAGQSEPEVIQLEQDPVVVSDESEASGDSGSPALDAQDEPKEVQAAESPAEDSPSTDAPVQFEPEVIQDEIAVSASPSENDEGSGSLVSDTLTEEKKESSVSFDGLEGSGFVAADAQPEEESTVSDGLVEEGSGALTADPVIGSDEGSGFFADHAEQVDTLVEEGSGSSAEPSEELKVAAPIIDESGDVAVAAVEADGSGDADPALGAPHADEESTAGPTVESDEPSVQEEAHSSPAEDHIEQSDDSPVKEAPKVEEQAEDGVKYIPVEVIVETEGQLNTEEKVNEPEVTESSLQAETDDSPSSDVAVLLGALPETLPEADNTESVLDDQPSVVENLPEKVAEDAPEKPAQPQEILQSDELISATEEPQQSSTLL